MVSRIQREARRNSKVRFFETNCRRQAIAESMNRLDDLLILIAEGLAHAVEGCGQDGVRQHTAWPTSRAQFVLGHHLPGMLQKVQ